MLLSTKHPPFNYAVTGTRLPHAPDGGCLLIKANTEQSGKQTEPSLLFTCNI